MYIYDQDVVRKEEHKDSSNIDKNIDITTPEEAQEQETGTKEQVSEIIDVNKNRNYFLNKIDKVHSNQEFLSVFEKYLLSLNNLEKIINSFGFIQYEDFVRHQMEKRQQEFENSNEEVIQKKIEMFREVIQETSSFIPDVSQIEFSPDFIEYWKPYFEKYFLEELDIYYLNYGARFIENLNELYNLEKNSSDKELFREIILYVSEKDNMLLAIGTRSLADIEEIFKEYDLEEIKIQFEVIKDCPFSFVFNKRLFDPKNREILKVIKENEDMFIAEGKFSVLFPYADIKRPLQEYLEIFKFLFPEKKINIMELGNFIYSANLRLFEIFYNKNKQKVKQGLNNLINEDFEKFMVSDQEKQESEYLNLDLNEELLKKNPEKYYWKYLCYYKLVEDYLRDFHFKSLYSTLNKNEQKKVINFYHENNSELLYKERNIFGTEHVPEIDVDIYKKSNPLYKIEFNSKYEEGGSYSWIQAIKPEMKEKFKKYLQSQEIPTDFQEIINQGKSVSLDAIQEYYKDQKGFDEKK